MNKKTICAEILVCMLIMLSTPALSEYGSSGGSGGSTGGSGVVTCEASDNIIKVEKHDLNIKKDIPSTLSFTESDLNMYQISIDGKEEEKDVALRIEYLKGMSVCVDKPAPGKIYQYVNMWISSQNIKDATLKFKIKGSSIANNRNLDVFKWNKNNKEWTKLGTVTAIKLDEDMHFELKIDGFGPFAIGIPGQGTSSGGIPIATATVPTTTGTVTVGKTTTKDISDVPIPLRKTSSSVGIVVIIGMLLYMTYARIGR